MSEETTDLLDEGRVSMDLKSVQLVKQFINIEQVQADCAINPTNIENELLGLSSIFARYGLLVARARVQRDGFKSRKSLTEALLEKEIRDKAAVDEEKVTNPQVAAKIAGNIQYVEADLALNEAAAVLAACTEARDAVKVKRDMLVQLNKNRATEYRGSSPVIPNILAPEAGDAEKAPLPPGHIVLVPAGKLFGTDIPAVTGPDPEVPADISDCL